MEEHICETIRAEIVAGKRSSGARLPSVGELARRFGTTSGPVGEAIVRLEQLGYVEINEKGEVFVTEDLPHVTLSRTIAVGLGAGKHVWGELADLLGTMVQSDERIPIFFDADDEDGRQQLMRLGRSEVQAFIVRGSGGFPYSILESELFANKIIVGIAEWQGPELPGMMRVLSDYEAGARELARYLFQRGHRRALVMAPAGYGSVSEDLEETSSGDGLFDPLQPREAFIYEWRKLGGEFQPVSVPHSVEVLPRLNEEEILSSFQQDKHPTVVFSTLDVISFTTQRLLRQDHPELADEVEFAGFYDTPWSQVGIPPFTSVNLQLQELAVRAHRMLQKALAGQDIGDTVEIVKPRVVVRNEKQ
ncbi:MAG: GntR family transcriptional regulator [Candidatus Brocadiia bacterium]